MDPTPTPAWWRSPETSQPSSPAWNRRHDHASGEPDLTRAEPSGRDRRDDDAGRPGQEVLFADGAWGPGDRPQPGCRPQWRPCGPLVLALAGLGGGRRFWHRPTYDL